MKNKKTKVLVTGGRGFISSHLIPELLENNYNVLAVDNEEKYGPVSRWFDSHKNHKYVKLDIVKDYKKFSKIFFKFKPQYVINLAAKIGGISYFTAKAYDLISANDRINSNVIDLCIKGNIDGWFKKIIQISSSMVFEATDLFPTPEHSIKDTKIPYTTYGASKLHSEYYVKGALQQYKLNYTILRPFNCVGENEGKSLEESEVLIGNQKMLMSHVLPDLINRALNSKPQDKCFILGDGNQVRQYTNGKDIARGIRLALESDKAINEDFNISTSETTSVKELAIKVWQKIHNCTPEFEYLKPFENDVQYRQSDTTKAKEILNFEAKIPLDQSIDEVIFFIRKNLKTGEQDDHCS